MSLMPPRDYSQFGEQAIVQRLVGNVYGMDPADMLCVEFGAADGIECSNTRALREQGATGFLIEADSGRWLRAVENRLPGDIALNVTVAPTGPCSIDHLLFDSLHANVIPDVMSVDIDGDEMLILQHMTARPRILIVEYNPSIPADWIVYPTVPGSRIGASLVALEAWGRREGYALVAGTLANAVFVDDPDAPAITPAMIQQGQAPSVVASSYDGDAVVLDDSGFYWGTSGRFATGLDDSHHVERVEQ